MLRVLASCVTLLILLPFTASARGWIYVYENGVPVGHAVGNDFEFMQVDESERNAANSALLGELQGYGPHGIVAGYGIGIDSDESQVAQQYKPLPDGTDISGVSVRDYLSPGDWQAVYGDWFGPRSWYVELDKSGPHWNWDSTSFNTSGYAWGQDADAYGSQTFPGSKRERYMTEAVWRRGSMEGAVFNLRGLAYETNFKPGLDQLADVKLKRLQGDFRAVEHSYHVAGAAYGGKYVSNRSGMDNAFVGGQLAAGHWLNQNVGMFADATATHYDIGGMQAEVTRSNWGGSVVLRNAGLSLTGFAREWNEASDLAANSHLRGYRDLGARLEYRPSGGTFAAAGYRRRNADFERLRMEDTEVRDMILADQAPVRETWTEYRDPQSAESARWDAALRMQLTQQLYFGAAFEQEDWDALPGTGDMEDSSLVPSYFTDKRTKKSAQLSYQTDSNGRITLRSYQQERNSSIREGMYNSICHALSYSSPVNRNVRLGFGVSRNERGLEIGSDALDWDAGSWDYDLSLAGGGGGVGSYRVSYRRSEIDGQGGSDSLGLEFILDELPVSVSAWWRNRQGALGGLEGFEDTGVNLGYYIELP